MTMSAVPDTFLVLAYDHPLRAVESVAERMAAGLSALGFRALALTVPRDGARLAEMAPEQVCGVLSLGPLPLTTPLGGRPLWEHFDACPVATWLLDAPLYDLARVPAMRSFLAAAQRDPRLSLVSPESGYRDWLGAHLGVRWDLLPYAAFPRLEPGSTPVPAQARIAVIGTVGDELGGTPVGESLPDLLQRVAGRIARTERLAALHDALRAPDAHALPARTVADVLGWDGAQALEREPLSALIAIDSWVKRQRRIDAVRSLAGQPVDFFGSGWQQVLGDVPGFRHVGRVHHDRVALLMPHYRAVLNCDPNWQGGVHDRVYTAAAMGATCVTNTNTGLAAAGLPADLVVTYDANRPRLAEQLDAMGLFSDATHVNRPRADVLARHNWSSRMADWLAGSPVGADGAPEDVAQTLTQTFSAAPAVRTTPLTIAPPKVANEPLVAA